MQATYVHCNPSLFPLVECYGLLGDKPVCYLQAVFCNSHEKEFGQFVVQ